MKHFALLTLISLTVHLYGSDNPSSATTISKSVTMSSSSLAVLSSSSLSVLASPLSSASSSPLRLGLAVTISSHTPSTSSSSSSALPPPSSSPLKVNCQLSVAPPHPPITCAVTISCHGCQSLCKAPALEHENRRLQSAVASQQRQIFALHALLAERRAGLNLAIK